MAANALVIIAGVLALSGLGFGMATLAQNPYGGMLYGGCHANGGGTGCPGGTNAPGAAGGPCPQNGYCAPANGTCPALQNGTCPAAGPDVDGSR
jgi:hypothetical protein